MHRSSGLDAAPEHGVPRLGLVTAANATIYFIAALLHLGIAVPLGFATLTFPEPIPAATVVEGLIGVALAAAAVSLLARGRSASRLTWAAYVFALVGTVFGLTVALVRGLSGPDIWVHFLMLAGLAAGFALLASGRRRPQPVATRAAGSGVSSVDN
jgi:hypothetical protein